jgi:hypothetical protein
MHVKMNLQPEEKIKLKKLWYIWLCVNPLEMPTSFFFRKRFWPQFQRQIEQNQCTV